MKAVRALLVPWCIVLAFTLLPCRVFAQDDLRENAGGFVGVILGQGLSEASANPATDRIVRDHTRFEWVFLLQNARKT